MGWLLRKAQTFAARRGVGYHSAPRPAVAVVRRLLPASTVGTVPVMFRSPYETQIGLGTISDR
jgi:hypothetical protein